MTKQRQPAGAGSALLSDAELGTVVGRAQQLAHTERAGHSAAEVAEVAAELALAPQHVAAAMIELEQQRETAALAPQVRRARWGRRGLVGLSAICAIAFAALLLAWSAAEGVRGAADDVVRTRARLGSALDRQARTISTLVIAAGAHSDELEQAAVAGARADDLATRETNVAALVRAAALAMAALPPAATPAAEQQRLSLSYELTGAENRVAVERSRHQAAWAHWQLLSASWAGRLALWFGLARSPEAGSAP